MACLTAAIPEDFIEEYNLVCSLLNELETKKFILKDYVKDIDLRNIEFFLNCKTRLLCSKLKEIKHIFIYSKELQEWKKHHDYVDRLRIEEEEINALLFKFNQGEERRRKEIIKNYYKNKNQKMENLIWDEVPVQRKRKEEKYSFPVVTLSAIDKIGAGRKFSFNKAAQELLGIKGEDRVSIGFSTDRTIIAVRKAIGNAGFMLTKTCSFSDKKTYDFIAKLLNLNIEQENNFMIEQEGNLNVLKLIQQQELGEISDTQSLDADLSTIPTTESLGIAPGLDTETDNGDEGLAEAVAVLEAEEAVFELNTTEDSSTNTIEETEEDAW